MAYIIRGDGDDRFAGIVAVFAGDDRGLREFFARTRANPYTVASAGWKTGTVIPPDLLPARVRILQGDALPDWRTLRGGACVVSARLKACIEAMDPGRHGFHPVVVEDRLGRQSAEAFVFNVVGCIDSIIEARSNLKATGRANYGISAWGYERRPGPWSCALDGAVIGGRACWTELHYGGRWFVSDALAAALRQAELTGFSLGDHCEEISASPTPAEQKAAKWTISSFRKTVFGSKT